MPAAYLVLGFLPNFRPFRCRVYADDYVLAPNAFYDHLAAFGIRLAEGSGIWSITPAPPLVAACL